jgi:hypothetical protein
MTLITFINADQNSAFTIALAVMLMIAVLEGITTLIGMGLSELFESILPDFEIDLSATEVPPSTLSRLLGWINFGKVPVLIIFVCFLTAFGIVGYMLQYLAYGTTSALIPQLFAVPAAFIIAVPFVRLFTNILQKVMPKDESTALRENSFVGTLATITLGKAKKGSPAEAKVIDKHGQTHYFMIQPEGDDDEFVQGEQVLLLRPSANGFYAIRNHNTSL